jgi:hypothetical protein
VFTLWSRLALDAAEKTKLDKAVVTASRDRALAWLKDTKPGDSHQALTMRLVVRVKHGTAEEVSQLVKEIQGRQKADGGWSWSMTGASDAIATGQALYAIGVAGIPADDPGVRSGRELLCKTQQKDGAWRVGGRNTTYFATAWAVMGLVRSTPK